MLARPCLNSVLALAAVAAFFIVREPPIAGADAGARSGGGGDFGVIVEKDLFRPSRKPEPPGAGLNPSPPPKPRKKPAPEVVLTGTVILDTGAIAMLNWQGVTSGSGAYAVGDRIEEFVIVDITKDTIVLKRGDEVLSARMSTGRRPAADWKPPDGRRGRAVKETQASVPAGGGPHGGIQAVGKGADRMDDYGGIEWSGE